MHTDAERNYAAKAARVRRASREDKSSLLDYIQTRADEISRKSGARVARQFRVLHVSCNGLLDKRFVLVAFR